MRTAVVVVVLTAATLVACGEDSRPAANPESTATTGPPVAIGPAPNAVLPAAEVLTGVLYRLADPAVPGDQKIALIEGATSSDAPTLDKFVKALQDTAATPLVITAESIRFAGDGSGNVTADVTMQSANPTYSFPGYPMTFKPVPQGWQLSRKDFDIILVGPLNQPAPPP